MKKLAISMMVFCSVMATSVAAWCGDNGNGTVTVGNLVVLKDAGCLEKLNWDTAMARPKSLADGQCGLTDKSKAGDWRLPTVEELKAMYAAKSQFKNVKASFYWSSSTTANLTGVAWGMNMYYGRVDTNYKTNNGYIWPVRAGQ